MFWLPTQSCKGEEEGGTRRLLPSPASVIPSRLSWGAAESLATGTADHHYFTHGDLGYSSPKRWGSNPCPAGRRGSKAPFSNVMRERVKGQGAWVSCSSRCDPQTNSLQFTWEPVRNAGPQAPPQTSWPGTCMLKSSQVTSMPSSLRSPGLGRGLQPRKDTDSPGKLCKTLTPRSCTPF